jgi:uridylate kinase
MIVELHDQGLEIAIVIGGGNIYRGLSAEKSGMDRVNRLYGHACHSHQQHGTSRCA